MHFRVWRLRAREREERTTRETGRERERDRERAREREREREEGRQQEHQSKGDEPFGMSMAALDIETETSKKSPRCR